MPDNLPIVTPRRAPTPARGQGFKTWHYATIKAAVKAQGVLSYICVDSGARITLVDHDWLLQQLPTVARTAASVRISPVGNQPLPAESWVTLELFIPATRSLATQPGDRAEPVIARLTIEAYVVKSLNTKLLLGSDSIGPHSMVLNYPRKSLIIGSCNVVVPMGVTAKGHAAPVQRAVRVKDQTVIAPRSIQQVPVKL